MFCPRSEFPMRLQDSPVGGAPGPASRSVPSSSAGNGRETPGSPLAWRDGRPQAWACCGPCKLGFEMLLPRQEIQFPGPRTQGPSLASTSLMGVHVLGCLLPGGRPHKSETRLPKLHEGENACCQLRGNGTRMGFNFYFIFGGGGV